jgi:hypothetical protein
MPQFISTDDGYINAERVISVHEDDDDLTGTAPTTIVYLAAEGTPKTTNYNGDAIDLDMHMAPVVAASPGYFALTLLPAPTFDIYMMPVVAWRILPSGADPVCPGVYEPGDKPVLYPDGRVFDSADEHWPSAGDWRKHVIDNHLEGRHLLRGPLGMPKDDIDTTSGNA